MRVFDSNVQLIKYKVLKEVAKLAFEGKLLEERHLIPKKIIPGPKPVSRCCIYKERAIIEERVQVAMGGNKNNKNVIEVIDIACDECPITKYTVTEACRGCLAHRCVEVCPVNAISIINQRAHIDHNKCIECGRCKSVCPYNAISEVMRPCIKACQVSALSINKDKKAVIDNDKCVQCGACVYQCPFGAIMDKSFIVDVINLLNQAKTNKDIHAYAVIAPAISSQFTYAKIGQVVKGIKMLGFQDVIEAALGADMVTLHEAKEFAQRQKNNNDSKNNFMTTSCCPAFVSYVQKKYPNFKECISDTVSPMIAISRLIKQTDDKAKVVFIGPCTAKKMEIMQEDINDATDYVITFEELQAMLDSINIKIEECEEDILDNASFFGRIFARTGGVTESIKHVIEEEKLEADFKPISCDGLKECDKALKIAKVGRLNANFIEGMACIGGCIGGAACLNHGPKNKNEVDKYGKQALEENVETSTRIIDIDKINMKRTYNK